MNQGPSLQGIVSLGDACSSQKSTRTQLLTRDTAFCRILALKQETTLPARTKDNEQGKSQCPHHLQVIKMPSINGQQNYCSGLYSSTQPTRLATRQNAWPTLICSLRRQDFKPRC